MSQSELILEKRQLDAERVTLIAEGFLFRLGYSRGVKPTKASLEGEKYVVELRLGKKSARIDLDLTTEEIKAYQIEGEEAGFRFPLTRRTLVIVGGVAAAAVLIALKLMGMLPF